MGRLWIFTVLNLPMLEEIIRKYLIHSDFVFLSADAIAIVTCIALIISGRISAFSIPPAFWFLSLLFVIWSAIVSLITSRHVGFFFIGLRAEFLPIIYLLISSHYFRINTDAGEMLFRSVTFWILASAAMAFLQLYLGKLHPINMVWGQSIGIGDYGGSEGEVLIKGLFRPTSLFTHTGKFGQALFCMILFKWCYLSFREKNRPVWIYATILIDIAALFASGQRAAFLFILMSLVIMFWLYSRKHGAKAYRYLFIILSVGGVILAAAAASNMRYASAIFERFYSTIEALPLRFMGNFVYPMQTILSEYLVSGEGLGFFTLGAQMFGGQLVYKYISMEGFGESSYIRLCGEVGVIAASLMVFAYLCLIKKAWGKYRHAVYSSISATSLYFVLWTTSLIMWSNTADVFANTAVTCLGYALAGAIIVRTPLRR